MILVLPFNFETIKSHIFPRLIDARPGKNCEYLANKVSTNIPGTDINIIYDVEIVRDEHGATTMSTPVTDILAEMWNTPPDTLHEIALQNAVEQRPLHFSDMNGILGGLAPGDFPELEVESLLYVLTNRSKQTGAVWLL